MTGPIVTVGVCVRNCASTIREAIESIMAQDYPHELMEVIFVDDGSEDETISIIKENAPKMNMKVMIFSHKWRGLGFSRNIVVDNANGDYIVWVDGDMRISRDYVKHQVELMERNPSIGIVKGSYGLSNSKKIVSFLEDVPFFVLSRRNANKYIEKCLGAGGAIYRVNAIKEVGGFDNDIKGAGEDIDIEYRIRKAGWSIYVSSVVFYERRPRTWGDLWRKYFWYGYGLRSVIYKNKNNRLYYMTPLAGFFAGLLYSFDAYRLTRRKIVFLLPIHFTYKMSAWWVGFIRNHLNFKHSNNIVSS
ncbi:MAG: glycosyltransferase [Candidatus Baldrarchaeia archaeon]